MVQKTLLAILISLVVVCLAAVLFLTLNPRKAQEIRKDGIQKTLTKARRPPPKPVGTPTPTPEPTLTGPRVVRQIRVKPELYPFRVTSSVTQENGEMRVTIEVKNGADQDWPTAYLTFSSAYHPFRAQYRLDNWRVGQIRTVDYVFPSAEVRERLKELRVEDVSSVPVVQAAQNAAAESALPEMAPKTGILGLWSAGRKALNIAPPPPEEMARAVAGDEGSALMVRGTGLSINLRGLGEIDAKPLPPVASASEDDKKARNAANDAMREAAETLDILRSLGQTLADVPWQEAMENNGEGAQLLEAFGKQQEAFFAKALEVQQLDARQKTRETQAMLKRVQQANTTILKYREALERQVRTAHPDFKLGQ